MAKLKKLALKRPQSFTHRFQPGSHEPGFFLISPANDSQLHNTAVNGLPN